MIIFIQLIILSQTCDSFNKIEKIITEYKNTISHDCKIVLIVLTIMFKNLNGKIKIYY